MQDKAVTYLMSELARLLSPRSSTPREEALRIAHRKIRAFAEVRHLPDEWCDAVLMVFLSRGRAVLAA